MTTTKPELTRVAVLQQLEEYRKSNKGEDFLAPPLREASDYEDVIEDSLDALDCLFKLEEHFGIGPIDMDPTNITFKTVGDFISWFIRYAQKEKIEEEE